MRNVYLIAFLLMSGIVAQAQTSLSFYHLGDATFQNSLLNPAYSPDGRIFIGLPVISGVHVHYNNKFSYNQGIKTEGTDQVLSFGRIISELQTNNMLSAHANVSLFHFGYRLKQGPVISLSVNERMEGDFLYPKQLIEFVWQGNSAALGNVVELGATGINVSHFREFGLGVAHQLNDQLKVGARLKMYQGFLNLSTHRNMTANLEVNPQTYAWQLETQNTMLRSSGMNIYGGDGDLGKHLMSPGNSGFGLDLGFEYDVNKYLSFAASVTDFGFIGWNTDIENKQFSDTTFNYAGVNIKNLDNLQQTLQDSLFDKFSTSTNSDGYKTWVPTKAYGSIIWKYTENTHFIGSVGARYIHGQMKMLYGGGVRHSVGPLTASVNAVKLPQQFFNVGAALAVRGGPVQYYLAADQMLNFSAPDMRAFEVRTGVNIIIGRSSSGGSAGGAGSTFDSSRLREGKAKGISTGSFLGEQVKQKGREGIYGVIKKQERRKVPKSLKKPKQKYPSKRRRY
jgi:hypothetical protein